MQTTRQTGCPQRRTLSWPYGGGYANAGAARSFLLPAGTEGWRHRVAGVARPLTCLLAGILLMACPSARADTNVSDCTQQALQAALAGGGTVSFTQDCAIAFSSPIVISTSVTLDAAGNTVTLSGGSGTNAVRLFTVASGVLTLKGLTLSDGRSGNGGAMSISSGALVTLTNCSFVGNSAVGTNGAIGYSAGSSGTIGGNGTDGTSGATGFGGAIYNLGSLTILDCQFFTNQAAGGNGGNGGNGGDGTFQGGNGGNGGSGAAGVGGAIYNGGTLSLYECTFAGNTVAGGSGGSGGTNGAGPFSGYPGSGGVGAAGLGAAVYSVKNVTIAGCTFYGNAARGGDSQAAGTTGAQAGVNGANGGDSAGGGVFIAGTGALTNCTFYSNQTTGGAGGDGGPGRYTGGNGGNGGNASGGGVCGSGSISVVNCTFSISQAIGGTNGLAGSGRSGGVDGTPGQARGGNIANIAGTFRLKNSILAGGAGGNGYGTITDGGYNISSDATPSTLGSTSLKLTAPKLTRLADNGGPTLTMAVTNGSPALDRIPVTAGFPPTDQRGVPRPINGKADVGAFEFASAGPPVITQQPTNAIAPADGTGSATFTVTVFGALPFQYQWRLDGTDIPSATQSSFTANDVTDLQAGPYDVVVANGSGSVTSAPALVRFSPSISSPPGDYTAQLGGIAFFVVTATGDASETLYYQWQFNRTNIAGATDSIYAIVSAQPTNLGPYQVVVTNVFGSITSPPANLFMLPGIAVQPTNLTVALSNSATFAVTAVGSSPLSYQWRLNSTNYISPNGNSSSYTIPRAQTNDIGAYDVVVTNRFGATTSAIATLTVLLSPVITVQPQDRVVPLGSTAVFAVTAAGIPPLAYQWQFYGTNLPGATGTNYTVSNAQSSNVGPYTVCITNAFGSITSAIAQLQLAVPPSILAQPADQFPLAGSNATFLVVAGGSPPLRYQWHFNGTNISGATTNTYTVVNARSNNVGSYTVRITNTLGSITSAIARLTLAVPPSIKTQPTNQILFAGSNAVFKVVAAGSQPLAYQWRFNAAEIAGATATNYTVLNAQSSNVGPYTVRITNAFGSITSSAAWLNLRPSILQPPVAQTVPAGSNATFSVTATGSPPLSYQWRFNATNLPGATAASYTVLSARSNNVGLYSVRITNAFGSVTSATARLDLALPPAIRTQPTNQILFAGSNAVFKVLAAGSQPLAYQWQFNAADLPGATGTNYTVLKAQSNNVGAYSVRIINTFGSITSATARLELRPSILQPPATQAVVAGSSPIFSVAAVGSPPLTYQWRFNGTNLPGAGATNSSYMVPDAQTNNIGPYTVRIANAFGSVTSAPARLEIRPTILTNPTNQTLIAGSKAQLSVRATGSTKLVYQWRKNGTNVINGVNVSGATSNVLTLTALATNNVGAYDVIITNRFGRTNSGVATLRVVSPFTISGRVWDGTNGVDGVRVAAAGTTNSDLTDSAGYYTVSGLKSNAYSVVPTAAGYRFDPASSNLVLGANISGVNFTAFQGYSLSGQVLEGTNRLDGVTVSVISSDTTNILTTIDGAYSLSGLRSNLYFLAPAWTGYGFIPANSFVTLQSDSNVPDFHAHPVLLIARGTNGVLQLSNAGNSGFAYQIQASTDYSAWTNISTNTVPFLFTDPAATDRPSRFYRMAR